ncbi:MAG: phosphoribosylformylglycinamidine cyclo-ligase [Methanoculleaceae archaeon]
MATRTYREAGVDIDLEAEAVGALVRQLTFRREEPPHLLGPAGHFAGAIEFGEYALALAVDGVGTKMLVADAVGDWSCVGIDCIAMNVNDMYVMNLEPVAFVDYIAADGPDPGKMAEIGAGLNEGARLANLNIVGGETATLKGLVTGMDLAGACLGIQRKDRLITGEAVRPGDLLVGVPSSGIHSNGLTLARRVVEEHAGWDERIPGGRTLAEELLTPTRIYREALTVAAECDIHGMCHITGGGLLNLLRIGRTGFDIDDPLPVPPIFSWIQETAGIPDNEMYRTFNMGMGYVFIVPPGEVDALRKIVPDARVVGECTETPGVRVRGTPVS